MTEALEMLRKTFEEKGKELQQYKEEHKIKIAGEDASSGGGAEGGRSDAAGKKDNAAAAPSSSGVLVT